jgi:hypothetical protein
MFVAEYDDGLIDKISLTNYAEVLTGGNAFYTFPAVSGYTAHCAGIGVYDGKIVALFNQGQGYSSYIASTLAIINPSDGSAVYLGPTGNDDPNNLPAGLGQNALGLTVDGGFAYVSSYGGPQQGGGNTTSKLEAVNLSTLTITGTHTAGSDGMGDFTSVAINGTDAYVLRASYTATWDQYNYNIYKTTTVVLQSNAPIISPPFNSGLEPPSGTTTTIYPGATWLLALTGGRLWAVLGDRVKAFDISGATPALDFEKTEYAYDANGNPAELGYYPAAADHTAPNNGEDNHLNTAAIAQTNVPAPTVTRGAPAAPSYSVSNRGAQHPAFISRTPEALKLRKKLIEEWKKNKK